MRIELALPQYLSKLKNETTRTNYEIVLRDFLGSFREVSQISKEHVRLYKDILSDKSPQTIAARLAAIRSFCDFCWSNGWISTNPALYIKNTPVEKYAQAKNISFDDFKKFVSLIDAKSLVGIRDLLLVRLIFFYGDPDKMLSLSFNQPLQEQFELIRLSYIKEVSRELAGKGGNPQKLNYGFLFFNLEDLDNSKSLSISAVRKVLIKYTHKANFPSNYIDFQALKRLRAKQIYEQTESVEAVQKFCGHKNTKITKAFLKTLSLN